MSSAFALRASQVFGRRGAAEAPRARRSRTCCTVFRRLARRRRSLGPSWQRGAARRRAGPACRRLRVSLHYELPLRASEPPSPGPHDSKLSPQSGPPQKSVNGTVATMSLRGERDAESAPREVVRAALAELPLARPPLARRHAVAGGPRGEAAGRMFSIDSSPMVVRAGINHANRVHNRGSALLDRARE